jgi:hypothetical protein
MFYTPKYCSNCGEKIERPNPSFTDSKRFCDVCKHDFVVQRAVPKIFIALMAIIGIFGIGSYWRSGEQPLTVSTRQLAANSSKTSANNTPQVSANSSVQQTAQTNNLQTNAANAPLLKIKPTDSVKDPTGEAVYFCGAPTKKGTPCSRRVRGGGRCWQHQGQNAMLPPEKLLVSQ